jgi:hypothetical protein
MQKCQKVPINQVLTVILSATDWMFILHLLLGTPHRYLSAVEARMEEEETGEDAAGLYASCYRSAASWCDVQSVADKSGVDFHSMDIDRKSTNVASLERTWY